jgi:hypothetical protein
MSHGLGVTGLTLRLHRHRTALPAAAFSLSEHSHSPVIAQASVTMFAGGLKRVLMTLALMLLITVHRLGAHDLFLKLDSYFVSPGATLAVRVLNGTFSTSEAAVARNRLRDLAVVTPAGVRRLDQAAWAIRGDTSHLTVRIGQSGTYLLGASLHPTEIRLDAKDFNDYLAHDGLPDVLAARRQAGELDRPARERYSKHVKAIVQVGDRRTEGYQAVLGYPAELIPLDNPYVLKPGDALRIRAMVDGVAVAGQLVTMGGPGAPRSVRTDSGGVARFQIGSRGAWYVKFIHMRPAAGDSIIDYESRWATLTFGIE